MIKAFTVIAALWIVVSAHASRWNNDNNPAHFSRVLNSSIITKMTDLPFSGKLSDPRLGWSESYWPNHKGGIAYRWNHPYSIPFEYDLHTKEELKKMTRTQLEQLSPAELYDISQGDYNYTLTKQTLASNSKNDLWWTGICDGWAQAAYNYPEPAQVVVRNPDGILVPFGSSDVKALLAMHTAKNGRGKFAQIGKKCFARGKVPGEDSERDRYRSMPSEEEMNSPICNDVNAGGFHVGITNAIGIHSKGMAADVDRFNDIWNQPVVSYESQIVGEVTPTPEDFMNGVEQKLHIKLRMVYGEELQFYTRELEAEGKDNFVSKKPVTRTKHQEFRHKDYEYILEIDRYGKIVGGEWISITRPDFIWIKNRDAQFTNATVPLAGLKNIYRPVKF